MHVQRPAPARPQRPDVRGRAAPPAGPAARRGAVQGPQRRAAPRRYRSDFVYDPPARSSSIPTRASRGASVTCSPPSPRTGSARATVKAFTARRPAVPAAGPHRRPQRQARWTPLHHHRVLQVLHNPRYAGAFAYGRRRQRRPRRARSATSCSPATVDRAHPRRPPRLHQLGAVRGQPGTAGRQRPSARQDRAPARPAKAPRCCRASSSAARCGQRMTVRYHHRGEVDRPRIPLPARRRSNDGHRRCQRSRARPRPAVGQLLLDTVTPVALEVALTVASRARKPSRRDRRSYAKRTSSGPATSAEPPGAATCPSTPTTGSSPPTSRPTGTRRSALCTPPKTTTNTHTRTATDASATSSATRPASALASDFPATVVRSPPPRNGNANAWSGSSSKTSPSPATSTSPRTHASKAGRHTRLTVPLPPPVWQARQTNPDTFKLIDQLLDDHTDAQTAEQLNQAGRRTGHRTAIHRPEHHQAPPGPQPRQPPPAAPRARAAHRRRDRPAARCVHEHDQELARRRPSHRPQGQRTQRTALRTTRRTRPPPPQARRLAPEEPASPPINPRRCSMKTSLWRRRQGGRRRGSVRGGP